MIGRRCRRELRFAHGAGTPGRDVEDAVPYNERRSCNRLGRDVEDAVPYNGRCSRDRLGRDVKDTVPYNGRRSRNRLGRDVEDAVPYNERCSCKTNYKQMEKTARKRTVFNLKKHFAAYSFFTERQALTDQTVSIRFPVCAVCACLSPGC